MQHPARGPSLGELGARVDHDGVRARPGDQGADVAGCGANRVGQQVQRGQHGRGFTGTGRHQQEDFHTHLDPRGTSAAQVTRSCTAHGCATGGELSRRHRRVGWAYLNRCIAEFTLVGSPSDVVNAYEVTERPNCNDPFTRSVHPMTSPPRRARPACRLAPSQACSPPVPQDGDRDPQPSRVGPWSSTAPDRKILFSGGPAMTSAWTSRTRSRTKKSRRSKKSRYAASCRWPSPGSPGCSGSGLILGAQTSGPDARTPYAIVIFGVQLMFVLAWTMALRPPAPSLVAGVARGGRPDRRLPGGLHRRAEHPAAAARSRRSRWSRWWSASSSARSTGMRVRDAFGTTLLIVVGVVSFSALIALTRKPTGTQAVRRLPDRGWRSRWWSPGSPTRSSPSRGSRRRWPAAPPASSSARCSARWPRRRWAACWCCRSPRPRARSSGWSRPGSRRWSTWR